MTDFAASVLKMILGGKTPASDEAPIVCQLPLPKTPCGSSATNGDELGVVAIVHPYSLPHEQQEAIFQRGLRYVLVAFNDRVENTESVLEHRAHYVGSDLLYLLVRRKEVADSVPPGCVAEPHLENHVFPGDDFEILGHSTYCYNPAAHHVHHEGDGSHIIVDAATTVPAGAAAPSWFLEGICTDPSLHGRGLGRTLLAAALSASSIQTLIAAAAARDVFMNAPRLLVSRTQNKAILWMLHQLPFSTRCVYPLQLAEEQVTQGTTPVFKNRLELPAFVEALVKGYFPENEAETLDVPRGIMVGVYQPERIECFGNPSPTSPAPGAPSSPPTVAETLSSRAFESKVALSAAVDALIDVQAGDAFIPVFDIASSADQI